MAKIYTTLQVKPSSCINGYSFAVVHGMCQGAQNCTVPVNTSILGDTMQCADSLKYFEAHYVCNEGECVL